MGNSESYQGNDCVFGEFQCPNCNRKWKSGRSWANTYQECINCGFEVYPHTQSPLRNRQHDLDLNKPHLMELCGRCQSLGRLCTDREESSSCIIL